MIKWRHMTRIYCPALFNIFPLFLCAVLDQCFSTSSVPWEIVRCAVGNYSISPNWSKNIFWKLINYYLQIICYCRVSVPSSDRQRNHVILFHISRWQQVANCLVFWDKRISDAWMPKVGIVASETTVTVMEKHKETQGKM